MVQPDAGHGVDISDHDMNALENIIKEQDRLELIIDREAEKRFHPIYEKRRHVLSKIPKFWPMALGQHAEIYAYLQNKEDQDAISYLKDVHITRNHHENRAFTIELHFNENPYFSDHVLIKQYKYKAPAGVDHETPDADGITPAMLDFNWDRDITPLAHKIHWKDHSKNLCAKYPPKGEDDEEDDAMDVETSAGSFFNLFEHEGDEHELGIVIADDIFPNAIDYFLGKGPNGLDAWEDDEDEDDEDEDADEIDLEKKR